MAILRFLLLLSDGDKVEGGWMWMCEKGIKGKGVRKLAQSRIIPTGMVTVVATLTLLQRNHEQKRASE
jgi:hypothetical protein